MKKRIEFRIVKEIIQSAFLPFKCTFGELDDKGRVQFRILNNNETLLLVEVSLERVCDSKRGLRFILKTTRLRLERKGHKLLEYSLENNLNKL